MSIFDALPESWKPALEGELQKPYIAKLEAFLEGERSSQTVFPPPEAVFRALELTPLEDVRVLILGQDPYHGPGQAHGLSFSVQKGVRTPPSLLNMFKELNADLGIPRAKHGFLEGWAQQGVLLLNSVLTVRQGEPNSHKAKGWEKFTDAVISALNEKQTGVIFVLWGAYAQKKKALITGQKHLILESVHPSPLSADRGFFGSKPFSKINLALENAGQTPIDWQLEK